MSTKPRRHFIVPDTQTRPGVPTEHLDWCAQAIVDYKPDEAAGRRDPAATGCEAEELR
jgi:hypothetical protein